MRKEKQKGCVIYPLHIRQASWLSIEHCNAANLFCSAASILISFASLSLLLSVKDMFLRAN